MSEKCPSAILRRWNIDGSITLSSRGKTLMKFKGADVSEQSEHFIKGWFGNHPRRVRTVITESQVLKRNGLYD